MQNLREALAVEQEIVQNFFNYSECLKNPGGPEGLEDVLLGDKIRLERIVSWGQTTPEGEWYDQEQDEWVLVLEGEAELEFCGREPLRLRRGDSFFLPRHLRHRVSYTSKPCIWLAVHGDLQPVQGKL